MKHISVEARNSIVARALNRNGKTLRQIAEECNIGYSTLQNWLRKHREGISSSHNNPPSLQLTQDQRFQILIDTATLDEKALGAYCREHGLFSYQLEQWKGEFMSKNSQQKDRKNDADLKNAKSEIKSLKQELRRKDKALAEASALLILKKKANLIWGGDEDE